MLGGNGFFDWIKEHSKQGIIGLLLAAMAACGITFPMLAIDNTNEIQDAQITAIERRVDINTGDIATNKAGIEELVGRLDDHLKAYALYTENTDKAIAIIKADILAINTWIITFYNDDEEALGEWQVFLAEWEKFKKDNDRQWASLSSSLSSWWNYFNSRINALAAEEEPEI
jgi:hypothetical protein